MYSTIACDNLHTVLKVFNVYVHWYSTAHIKARPVVLDQWTLRMIRLNFIITKAGYTYKTTEALRQEREVIVKL